MIKFKSILLLIDDNVSYFNCRRILNKIGAFDEIIDAINHKDALKHLEKHCSDLILLDLTKSVNRELQFLTELQNKNLCLKSKVAILTVSISTEEKKKFKKFENVIGIIKSPLSKDKMFTLLTKLLS
ncbi:MAG: hypothetical protein IH948_03220 [Bacteroidetes bacterium]|nr:hypothetical protein [Bacteroidota bacterium]